MHRAPNERDPSRRWRGRSARFGEEIDVQRTFRSAPAARNGLSRMILKQLLAMSAESWEFESQIAFRSWPSTVRHPGAPPASRKSRCRSGCKCARSVQPASANILARSFIGRIFLPPTLIPRSSATWVMLRLTDLKLMLYSFRMTPSQTTFSKSEPILPNQESWTPACTPVFAITSLQIFSSKHGMISVGYFAPRDEPLSKNTLIYILGIFQP